MFAIDRYKIDDGYTFPEQLEGWQVLLFRPVKITTWVWCKSLLKKNKSWSMSVQQACLTGYFMLM